MTLIRRQLSYLALAFFLALTVAGVAGHQEAHAWNTYNSSCSSNTVSIYTGGFTALCFDLTATWEGSYWQMRESGWSSDGQTPVEWHFDLQDWICGNYDPPDYTYSSSAVQWTAITEGLNLGSCGPQIASGNSWGGGSWLGASRGVSQFSVWN